MVVHLPQHWDVAIDGIQIFLCILILGVLIRNGRRNRESARDIAIGESGPNFNAQMFAQSLRQQVDEAFANIAKTIALEQGKLEKTLPTTAGGIRGHALARHACGKHRPDEPPVAPAADGGPDRDPLLDKIRQLASKGQTAGQISEEVKVPLGEVELVLSLRAESDN
ncbi:hypothetical protein D1AOALGA4SA_5916 [Olavius algarvensis Delta 1 endosymbiont]|nr:hypothetical protein D1AOALGA4SA_5916 [Olavius algarvensis Delta 1 endosymbiont]